MSWKLVSSVGNSLDWVQDKSGSFWSNCNNRDIFAFYHILVTLGVFDHNLSPL